MFVVWVALVIELYESNVSAYQANTSTWNTHKFEDGDFHHTLIEVSRLVLHDLDCDNFVGFHVLAFDNLPKRSLSKDIKNKVSSATSVGVRQLSSKDALMAFLISQPIIDVEDIVVVLVVVAVIV